MLATQPRDESCSEEKLRWAFRIYDRDSSGQLPRISLFNIHKNTSKDEETLL